MKCMQHSQRCLSVPRHVRKERDQSAEYFEWALGRGTALQESSVVIATSACIATLGGSERCGLGFWVVRAFVCLLMMRLRLVMMRLRVVMMTMGMTRRGRCTRNARTAVVMRCLLKRIRSILGWGANRVVD